MESSKVLCHWSGFWNIEGAKEIESQYESFELTDLENIELTSWNVPVLSKFRFQNQKINSRNLKNVNKAGSVTKKRSELILKWSRLDIDEFNFVFTRFFIWWNTCQSSLLGMIKMKRHQNRNRGDLHFQPKSAIWWLFCDFFLLRHST